MARRQRRGKPKKKLAPKEARRLIQLAVCLVLFLAVFVGRGFLPHATALLRNTLTDQTDFKAAFARLGQALEPGGSVVETLGRLWQGEPSPAPVPPAAAARTLPPPEPSYPTFLDLDPTPEPDPAWTPEPEPLPTPEPTEEPTPEPTPAPTPTPPRSGDGAGIPEHVSAAYVPLELPATRDPVEDGAYTSGYGWRTYPLGDGVGRDFHYGVDITAAEGTPVHAFADGVVDYVGVSPSYGQYIQIRHSDRVCTFYAHCSALLKGKGEKVSMGDVIARSGSTGNVTGPHLHFEVKIDSTWHDPAYYLSF